MNTAVQQLLADMEDLPDPIQQETLAAVSLLLQNMKNLPDQIQQETLAAVRLLLQEQAQHNERNSPNREPSGTRLARLMQEASSKNLFSHIKDPAAWQREIRTDRPLPGRAENHPGR